jgi:hypothetical protein
MPARKYKSTATSTTLDGSMIDTSNGVVGTMKVASTSSFPTSYPFTLVVAPDTVSEEIVTVTGAAVSGTYPVIRGEDGTESVAHSAGDVVRHMITARDLQEPQDHIYATTAVHGLLAGVSVAPSANPTFTGTVVLPSATSIGPVSSTEIDYLDGVTSNIQTQFNQAKLIVQTTAKTANYTLASGDEGNLIKLDATSGAIIVTVPVDATFNFAIGTQINLVAVNNTNAISIAAASGTVAVNGTPGLNFRAQWSTVTLVKIASNTWIVVGDLVA